MPTRLGNVHVNARRALLACLAALAFTCAVSAFPKPAPVPFRWELNFEPGHLRLYVDQETGGTYWYFTYTVTNRTGKEQLWAPSLVLYTDNGEILEAGRDVPSQVVEEIRDMLGDPLIEDQNQIIGDIFQGREHAKEGVVVWPANHLNVTEMSLFIAGISGETARVKNPVNGQEIILRKTLQRDYLVPGNALARGSEPVQLVQQQWILR